LDGEGVVPNGKRFLVAAVKGMLSPHSVMVYGIEDENMSMRLTPLHFFLEMKGIAEDHFA